MTKILEVKADLPGPRPNISVLPSYDSVHLVRPGAAVWNTTEKGFRDEMKNPISINGGGKKKQKIKLTLMNTNTMSVIAVDAIEFLNPNEIHSKICK